VKGRTCSNPSRTKSHLDYGEHGDHRQRQLRQSESAEEFVSERAREYGGNVRTLREDNDNTRDIKESEREAVISLLLQAKTVEVKAINLRGTCGGVKTDVTHECRPTALSTAVLGYRV
jgi:hypothetical protein